MVEAARAELRSAAGIAAANGVNWPTIMCELTDFGQTVCNVDYCFVRRLGIEEHRFRRVRYVWNSSGKGPTDRIVVHRHH